MDSNEREMFENSLLSSLSMCIMYIRNLLMYEITKSTTNALLDGILTLVDIDVFYFEYYRTTNVSNMSDDHEYKFHRKNNVSISYHGERDIFPIKKKASKSICHVSYLLIYFDAFFSLLTEDEHCFIRYCCC